MGKTETKRVAWGAKASPSIGDVVVLRTTKRWEVHARVEEVSGSEVVVSRRLKGEEPSTWRAPYRQIGVRERPLLQAFSDPENAPEQYAGAAILFQLVTRPGENGDTVAHRLQRDERATRRWMLGVTDIPRRAWPNLLRVARQAEVTIPKALLLNASWIAVQDSLIASMSGDFETIAGSSREG